MGPGKEKIKKPRQIEGLPEISQVSAGYNSSLVLAANGEVWGAGKNLYGELGSVSTRSEAVERIENIPKMKSTFTANNHSLFLDLNGHVWVSGNKFNHGLGLEHTRNGSSPFKLENLPPIKSIAAGLVHSVLLDEENRVWVFGGNNENQLGVPGTVKAYEVPTLLEELRDIHSISASLYHSIFIGNEKAYVAGVNYNGVLASQSIGEHLLLQRAELLENIPMLTSVSTLLHSLFVDHTGSVWSCGRNYNDQFWGNTPDQISATPVQIQGLPCISKMVNHSRVKSARNV